MSAEEIETMVQQPLNETRTKTSLETSTPQLCLNSKFVKVEDYMTWTQNKLDPGPDTGWFEPPGLEVETDDFIRADCRVITGIGARIGTEKGGSGNLTTLRVAYRLLDSTSGLLGPVKYITAGYNPNNALEVWSYPVEEENDDQTILCGFGARANPKNITTLSIWTRDILPDGTLARPVERRYGSEKTHILEALIMVPNPGIIVGVGMRGADGSNVTHQKAWFGHLKSRQS